MQPVGERSHDPRDFKERPPATVRMTVQQAAEALGVTVEAVRGRMHRGKYQKEKDEEGRVFVLLSPDQLPNGREEVKERSSERLGSSSGERSGDRSDDRSRTFGPTVYKRKGVADPELVEELRGEVAYLKEIISTRDEELRRKDTIIMQMAQRIPELEAAHTPRETPVTDSDVTDSDVTDSDVTDSEGANGGVVPSEPPVSQRSRSRRSWWRRFFGFE